MRSYSVIVFPNRANDVPGQPEIAGDPSIQSVSAAMSRICLHRRVLSLTGQGLLHRCTDVSLLLLLPTELTWCLVQDDWYDGYYIPKGSICIANVWWDRTVTQSTELGIADLKIGP